MRDDLCVILNQMFFAGNITPTKTREILCLPKPYKTPTPSVKRPIALLNTDYKIVAGILAHRLSPVMATYLKTTQYSGVPGNNILDAVATI